MVYTHMSNPETTDPVRKALEEFVADVEDAGGVRIDEDNVPHPGGDEEWTNLGYTYLRACEALGRKPEVTRDDDDHPAAIDEDCDDI